MEDVEPPDHPAIAYESSLSYKLSNAYGGVIIVHCISKKDLWHVLRISLQEANYASGVDFHDAEGKTNIFLFFSVNGSGQFVGTAEVIGTVDYEKNMDFFKVGNWYKFKDSVSGVETSQQEDARTNRKKRRKAPQDVLRNRREEEKAHEITETPIAIEVAPKFVAKPLRITKSTEI